MTETQIQLGHQLSILGRTPAVLDRLLRGIEPVWQEANEGPGTWSPREVVGHLAHAEETNWIPRAKIILAAGSSSPFPPFDRFAHLEMYRDWRIEDLLDRFAGLRERSLEEIRGWNLGAEELSFEGLHPALGPVTLGQLIATWVAHDLGHIAQIVRTMARARTDAVGPWREYLSLLR